MCGTYKIFYAEEETEEMVLEQWEDLKAEINVPTLRTLSFHQLWANMLVQYADEYALGCASLSFRCSSPLTHRSASASFRS